MVLVEEMRWFELDLGSNVTLDAAVFLSLLFYILVFFFFVCSLRSMKEYTPRVG